MSKILKKLGEQAMSIELTQDDLLEIYGNSPFRDYYIRNNVVYLAIECPVKMYLWKEKTNPDNGEIKKDRDLGRPGDYILLGSDKSIQFKAPDKMFNFEHLVLPTHSDIYIFLPAP